MTGKGQPPDKAEELRALIREANGLLKDMRRERRELDDALEGGVQKIIQTRVDEHMEALASQVAAFQRALQKDIVARMDAYAKMVLGDEDVKYPGMLGLLERTVRGDDRRGQALLEHTSEIYRVVMGEEGGLPLGRPGPPGGGAASG